MAKQQKTDTSDYPALRSRPTSAADIPQAIKDAYKASKNIDYDYSNCSDKDLETERAKYRQLEKEAEHHYYSICDKFYARSVWESLEFEEILSNDYENSINQGK